MNFRNAFGREPVQKIVQRSVDVFGIRTVLTSEQWLHRLLTCPSAKNDFTDFQETGLRLLLDKFPRLPNVLTAFKLFDDRVGFFPDRRRIDVLEAFEICKLQACPQHGFGIDWKVLGHCYDSPKANPNST